MYFHPNARPVRAHLFSSRTPLARIFSGQQICGYILPCCAMAMGRYDADCVVLTPTRQPVARQPARYCRKFCTAPDHTLKRFQLRRPVQNAQRFRFARKQELPASCCRGNVVRSRTPAAIIIGNGAILAFMSFPRGGLMPAAEMP